jgi:hypothetical protein
LGSSGFGSRPKEQFLHSLALSQHACNQRHLTAMEATVPMEFTLSHLQDDSAGCLLSPLSVCGSRSDTHPAQRFISWLHMFLLWIRRVSNRIDCSSCHIKLEAGKPSCPFPPISMVRLLPSPQVRTFSRRPKSSFNTREILTRRSLKLIEQAPLRWSRLLFKKVTKEDCRNQRCAA